jgi:hypothetical protein
MDSARPVERVVRSAETFEGEGFRVHRPFPSRSLIQIDPFLLLDEIGPVTLAPGEATGAADHPHRGFETVTYVLEGSIEHLDSSGRGGRIGPGDVQWMTAGRGLIHSEMPGSELVEHGGRLHGVQLWVNLTAAQKSIDPAYQAIASSEISEWVSDDGSCAVRLLAGEALGARARVQTRTPILYLHVRLQRGGEISLPLEPSWNAFVYSIGGSVRSESEGPPVPARSMGILGRGGSRVSLRPDGDASEFLLVAGAPLGEPVARFGPFVMNTREELMEAVREFQEHGFA